jgi:hypothetical protein
MRTIPYLAVLVALTAGSVACNRTTDPGTVKSESKTEVKTPQGTQTTETTTEKVGSTMESTTETTVKTPDGTVETKVETVLGTVSEFKAGENIEIVTGDNNKHSFDLDDADVIYNIDPTVVVGSKVKLDQRTNDAGKKVIEVRLNAV